jgi:hypothetical protein
MANIRTALAGIPMSFLECRVESPVYPIKVAIDTINTNVAIMKPEKPENYIGIVGWNYSKNANHILTLSSASIASDYTTFTSITELTVFELQAGFGFAKQLDGKVLLLSEAGKGLVIKSDVAIASMLIYAAEFGRFAI